MPSTFKRTSNDLKILENAEMYYFITKCKVVRLHQPQSGSFGIVETTQITLQGGNWDSSLYVPNQLILGSDTDNVKYTSNVLEFRCGGSDLRFDGNNGKVIVESRFRT